MPRERRLQRWQAILHEADGHAEEGDHRHQKKPEARVDPPMKIIHSDVHPIDSGREGPQILADLLDIFA